MKKYLILLVVIFLVKVVDAQTARHVLFLGNSYTAVNNLPQLIADIALNNGDTLVFDSNTPGGYTLQLHCTDASSLNKIAQGVWDFVVLQEQSQLPSFDPAQVATDVLPYAQTLDSLINASDSCTETLFYMTWGRKNGDAANCPFYPPVCTYEGMQERLRESYVLMAQLNHATVAPVGAAWREVRATNPAFDLYNIDESHPSIYGSYLAACVFYEIIFNKSVLQTTYTNILTTTEADLIKSKVHQLLTDSLSLWAGNGDAAFASFNKIQNGNAVQFNNTSLNAANYSWSFGDGNFSSNANPNHVYSANGNYTVQLTSYNNCFTDTYTDTVAIVNAAIESADAFKPKITYSDGELKIENIKPGIYNLKISNLTGSTVKLLNFIAPQVSNFKLSYKGVYLITIANQTTGQSYTDKLMMK
ncbi:MAG: PKD domain-containing protein [Bacteroidia bacterium]